MDKYELLFEALERIRERAQQKLGTQLENGIWYPNGQTLPGKYVISHGTRKWEWWLIIPYRRQQHHTVVIFEPDLDVWTDGNNDEATCIICDESIRDIVTEEMWEYSQKSHFAKINIVLKDPESFYEESRRVSRLSL